MANSERAAFQAEVAQVERWFQVWPLFLPPSLLAVLTTVVEPSLCTCDATIHRCSGRLKARNYPHQISCRDPRQEAVCSTLRARQEWDTFAYIRSVSPMYSQTKKALLMFESRLDPVQVTQMAKYLETVYVSGWQSSSTASSTNEPGPDLAGESSCHSWWRFLRIDTLM
jgi:isocitrate lyase